MIRRSALEHRPSRKTTETTVQVGSTLPSDVELMTFPDTVYAEVPDLRPYRYTVVQDEVVLVDPGTDRVIDVLQ